MGAADQRIRAHRLRDVPRPLPAPDLMPGELYSPGTYYVDEVDGTPTPRIFATLDAGWRDMVNGSMWMMLSVEPWRAAAA